DQDPISAKFQIFRSQSSSQTEETRSSLACAKEIPDDPDSETGPLSDGVSANNCWLIPEVCTGIEIEVPADGLGKVSGFGGKNAKETTFRSETKALVAVIAADTPASRLADLSVLVGVASSMTPFRLPAASWIVACQPIWPWSFIGVPL